MPFGRLDDDVLEPIAGTLSRLHRQSHGASQLGGRIMTQTTEATISEIPTVPIVCCRRHTIVGGIIGIERGVEEFAPMLSSLSEVE